LALVLLRFGQLIHPVGFDALLGHHSLLRGGVFQLCSGCFLLSGVDLGLLGPLRDLVVVLAFRSLLVCLFLRGGRTLAGLLLGLALALLPLLVHLLDRALLLPLRGYLIFAGLFSGGEASGLRAQPAHPQGGPKARVFTAVLGITRTDWQYLRPHLRPVDVCAHSRSRHV